MENRFKLSWTKLDIIVIISTLLISLFLSLLVFFLPSNSDSLIVKVYYDNQVIYETNLLPKENESDPRYIILFKEDSSNKYDEEYPNSFYNERTSNLRYLLDDIIIEISNKKVKIVKETSPNHICSRQGEISSPTTPLLCEPNFVVVRIIGDKKDPDDVFIP